LLLLHVLVVHHVLLLVLLLLLLLLLLRIRHSLVGEILVERVLGLRLLVHIQGSLLRLWLLLLLLHLL
jgi:hypothetical protein